MQVNVKTCLSWLLNSSSSLADGVAHVLDCLGDNWHAELAEMLAAACREGLRGGKITEPQWQELWRDRRTAPAFFVRATATPGIAPAQSLALLKEAMERVAEPDPVLLRTMGSLLAKTDPAAAIPLYQQALLCWPPYVWYLKTYPELRRLMASDGFVPRRRSKLALLSASTTTLLTPVLQMAAFAKGISLEIYEAPFGAYQQEILDKTSGLYAFGPDFVLLLVNHRMLDFGPVDKQNQAQLVVESLRGLWKTLQASASCHIIATGFDMPCLASWGALESTLPQGRIRQIRQANLDLSADLPDGVSFLDVDRLSRLHAGPWDAPQEYFQSKQYPAAAALPLLADAVVAQIGSVLGLSAKVLALDLDNTCWGGIIGEDLFGGIKIGPPDAAGEAHAALQRYAKELKERGVLLTVCSKNNPDDAREPFLKHDAMILKLEDLVAFTANWADKATNLIQQAQDLQLGIDSFVFLDDNPIERALVRQQMQATVPISTNNPTDMLLDLQRSMYFEATRLTQDDLRRQESYSSLSARKELQQQCSSTEEFLKSLHMQSQHGAVSELTLARVTQLTNKSNQFNLTTRRYTEAQIKEFTQSPQCWTHWFGLKDRFGDHGIIGVMLAHCQGQTLDGGHLADELPRAGPAGGRFHDQDAADGRAGSRRRGGGGAVHSHRKEYDGEGPVYQSRFFAQRPGRRVQVRSCAAAGSPGQFHRRCFASGSYGGIVFPPLGAARAASKNLTSVVSASQNRHNLLLTFWRDGLACAGSMG